MRIVDAHHHFLSPSTAQPFLGKLGAPEYTPEQYTADAAGLQIEKTVHVEALADGDDVEAKWVEGLAAAGRCKVAAIVAACDLAAPDAGAALDKIIAASPKVKGIRWIVDYDGPFDGGKTCGTHVAVSRFGLDYLRDSSGPAADFERGFALLAGKSLSFDLQCVPSQLSAAAALVGRHPGVTVVIDHLGKPRHLMADAAADAAQLDVWRAGMKQLAALPNTYAAPPPPRSGLRFPFSRLTTPTPPRRSAAAIQLREALHAGVCSSRVVGGQGKGGLLEGVGARSDRHVWGRALHVRLQLAHQWRGE
jgi:predicted TIM-barrel fold metal-dependent hydrolase